MSSSQTARLSLDIPLPEHRKIKALAALHGQTIREFILGIIQKQLGNRKEEKELRAITSNLKNDPILVQLWDNKKDAEYDKM